MQPQLMPRLFFALLAKKIYKTVVQNVKMALLY